MTSNGFLGAQEASTARICINLSQFNDKDSSSVRIR
jgi:hypothetical protein